MMIRIDAEYVKNMRKKLKEDQGLTDEQVDSLLRPHSLPTGHRAILKRPEGSLPAGDTVDEVG